MLFGHNTNIKIGEMLIHVQTEDRGISRAMIDTTVYCSGRVLHRRTNPYEDLLPLDSAREEKLRTRLNAQHHAVLQELRSGTLKLPPMPLPAPAPVKVSPESPGDDQSITLELTNARSWLAGKRATLQVAVRNHGGAAVANARVTARIDGAAERAEFSAQTDAAGRAQLAFDMPRLAGGEPALVIEASHGEARGHLRFQLRAKPKVPAE
jgi:hypothetical protein